MGVAGFQGSQEVLGTDDHKFLCVPLSLGEPGWGVLRAKEQR